MCRRTGRRYIQATATTNDLRRKLPLEAECTWTMARREAPIAPDARRIPRQPAATRAAREPSQDVLTIAVRLPVDRTHSSISRITSAMPPEALSGPTWIRA